MTKAVLLQMIGAVLLFAAWQQGWVLPIFEQDATRISWLIAAAFVLGVLLLPDGHVKGISSRWIANMLPMLGIMGTVIGLKITIGGMESDNLAMADFGLATALNTTVAGLIGSAWLRFSKRLLG